MIDKLKKLFPSLEKHSVYQGEINNRLWFTTKEGQFISIEKEELSKEDRQLLSVFLRAVEDSLFPYTKLDTLWLNRILHEGDIPAGKGKPFRLVYFEIESESFEANLFKDATREVFQREVPILWVKETEGIIVEEQKGELIDYTQIIDLLMSDLYVNIKFYVGQIHEDYQALKEKYKRVLKNGRLGSHFVKKAVFSYIDILPYKLVQSIDPSIKEELIETTLSDLREDKETLTMIESFIECNLNVSLTAKKLYLHRNSLQYRLDKFIEQTNIDIRQFHHALAVYMALLSLKEK